jgi:hypothetical protein
MHSIVRADEGELSFRIERTTIVTGPEKYYFTQSRGAVVPGAGGLILVTSQEAERVGSHGYHDVFQIESRDGGRTWTEPARIESLRRQHLPTGDDFAIGDLCPQWHAATGKVLGTGKTFTFHDRVREDRSLERVSYSVYSPDQGSWSGLQLLDLPVTDQSGKPILQPNSGCCQRFDLPGGDILLPIRYCREAKKLNYTTMVARCRFDGKRLTYVRHGSELSRAQNRGLYEPSLTRFKDHFYLTLRADDTALVARSADGLTYEDPIEWKFDDGKPLGSYNTQQHWVTHREGLFLVYTRRGAENDHIFRHRAPLFIARVDPERLCVLRGTEQVLVPQNHADLGNFGVVDVSPTESWVVVAEYPATGKRKDDRNQVFAAKILWSKPNGP